MKTAKQRILCPRCAKSVSLNSEMSIRDHKANGTRCPGSGSSVKSKKFDPYMFWDLISGLNATNPNALNEQKLLAVAKTFLKPGEVWEYLTHKQLMNRWNKAIAFLDAKQKKPDSNK